MSSQGSKDLERIEREAEQGGRQPTHPGTILKEEFMKPLDLSVEELADYMGMPVRRIDGLVHNNNNLTTVMAVKLGGVFDTTPQFWLNLQNRLKIWVTKQMVDVPDPIKEE